MPTDKKTLKEKSQKLKEKAQRLRQSGVTNTPTEDLREATDTRTRTEKASATARSAYSAAVSAGSDAVGNIDASDAAGDFSSLENQVFDEADAGAPRGGSEALLDATGDFTGAIDEGNGDPVGDIEDDLGL